ncbi:MAG: phosphoadenylyl-sulfate reductase [Flavobacteriales bacterium]|nr:phosphoadenylyl-sulfate reductase [Flavobacteriales bacterium]
MDEFKEDIDKISNQIEKWQEDGLSMFLTSSFQSHSIPLLHIISVIDNQIPIYFLQTGYHFPETMRFRRDIQKMLDLNLIDISSNVPRNQQRDANGQFLFTSDPDTCCYLNKTKSMDSILPKYDIWISGVRKSQNANRKSFQEIEKTPNGTLRYHPILDWSNKMIYNYAAKHGLPKHPLEKKGYLSIGCQPCTKKFDPQDERGGRWAGLNKTECGLHTELLK